MLLRRMTLSGLLILFVCQISSATIIYLDDTGWQVYVDDNFEGDVGANYVNVSEENILINIPQSSHKFINLMFQPGLL